MPTDVGRPFRDLAPRVTDAALLDDCRRVLDTLTPLEAVVRVDHADAYLRRVLPYRTADRRVDGVVITWVDITKRLAAEAESRHLTAVLRDSNDAVALVDLDGRITGWNRGAELLYGYTEAEARALRVRDLAPAPLQSAVDDLVTRLARGEVASESIETQRRTKDGQVREIWSTMTLLRDAAGDSDAVVVTDRDFTELKEAIAARQAAMFYEQVIENLPAGAVLRADGRLTLNRAAEVITGHSRGELSSVDAWCAFLHGDSAGAFRAFCEAGPSGEHGKETAQLAITRRDGAVRHVECSMCRLNAAHELWLLRDVTDTDEAELALRRSEDYLRSIVDTAADGIITIDEQGLIDTFNRAAERMFGYTAAEVVGRNVNLLMPPPFSDEHDDYLARYVKTREARIIGIGREVLGRRKDGTTFPLALSVSEIDSLGRFVGVLHDLSERQALRMAPGREPVGRAPPDRPGTPRRSRRPHDGHRVDGAEPASGVGAGPVAARRPRPGSHAEHQRSTAAGARRHPWADAGRGNPRGPHGGTARADSAPREHVGNSLPIHLRASRSRR